MPKTKHGVKRKPSMSYFAAASSRPEGLTRNPGADDDTESTLIRVPPAGPAISWTSAPVTAPTLLLIGGTSAAAAFLDIAFPASACTVVGRFGTSDMRRVDLEEGTFALVIVTKSEVSPEASMAWSLSLRSLAPSR